MSVASLTSLARLAQTHQFLLERLIQEFVPMGAKKDKQFGSSYPFHDPLLLLGKLHWRLP
jgi:hypothetical protein